MQINDRIKRILVMGVAFIGLITSGCDRPEAQAPSPPPLPEVATVRVQPQQIVLTTELPGHTAPYMIAEIRPQVNGLIQKRLFTEGSDVKAGQVLYEIDPAPFQAELNNFAANLVAMQKAADRARATLAASRANVTQQRTTMELARINRNRFEEAFKDRAVSASERDQAVTKATVAEAALQAAGNQDYQIEVLSGAGHEFVTKPAYLEMLETWLQHLSQ